eukprot:CAMPEP_0174356832 /NCGR_PEP_ID=MMETSP0811_2-20130205/32259_1 /TAXON_ID=73025 ORGANISM="Eutreptiella gymnastica-like, Strain CCMP1594" /NCGR_SAMPLE_ID=MMETSP0811_2 /ASSEMBLY_ACC=CAM_ASM_000667 /LENGTH=189 /DNA_ID=CAMNT_0015489113 /DNA_START=530 /DNA_END=1096 /DNA_ORIENTATION=+
MAAPHTKRRAARRAAPKLPQVPPTRCRHGVLKTLKSGGQLRDARTAGNRQPLRDTRRANHPPSATDPPPPAERRTAFRQPPARAALDGPYEHPPYTNAGEEREAAALRTVRDTTREKALVSGYCNAAKAFMVPTHCGMTSKWRPEIQQRPSFPSFPSGTQPPCKTAYHQPQEGTLGFLDRAQASAGVPP